MGWRLFGLATGLAALMAVTLSAPPALAESDLCQATALIDINSWLGDSRTGPPDIVLHKGDTYDAISVYEEDPQTGVGMFCVHGGVCLDRYQVRNGVKVEALRLQNCSIRKVEHPQPNGYEFELVLDRSKVSPATLRYNDIDDRLLQLGMCNVCADNAADEYIRHPQSTCSQVVKSALEGNPDAAEQLDRLGACAGIQDVASDASSATAADPPPTAAENAPDPPQQHPSSSHTTSSDAKSAGKVTLLIIFTLLAVALYFLPTVIAGARRKRNVPAIFALNLLLGWTFLGWVASLVWSVVRDPSPPVASEVP